METALARLRAKTDQELCILVARQLHRSRSSLGLAALSAMRRKLFDGPGAAGRRRSSPNDRTRLERLMHEVRQTIEFPMTAVA